MKKITSRIILIAFILIATWATAINAKSQNTQIPTTTNFVSKGNEVTSKSSVNMPMLVVLASTNPICNGSSTILTAWGSYASSSSTFNWSNGSTVNPITVTPTTTTTYTVTVVTQNGYTASCPITVTVKPKPTVTINSGMSLIICAGSSCQLAASGASTYSWSMGSTVNPITVAPTTTTTYYVTGTDGNGCTNVAATNVAVTSKPTITVSASVNPICNGNSTVLTAGGGFSYVWSNGSTVNPLTVTPTSTTTYTVTGTTKTGCSNTSTITITVNPLPPTYTGLNQTICSGNSVLIGPAGHYVNTSFSWSPATGLSCTNCQQPTASPTTTTTYALTVTNTLTGCSSISYVTVTVNPKPTVTISASVNPICSGHSETLTAAGASTYSWCCSLGTGNPKTLNPTATTTYTVTGTNTYGCTNTAQVKVTILTNSPACQTQKTIDSNESGNSSVDELTGNSNSGISFKLYPNPAKDEITISSENKLN